MNKFHSANPSPFFNGYCMMPKLMTATNKADAKRLMVMNYSSFTALPPGNLPKYFQRFSCECNPTEYPQGFDVRVEARQEIFVKPLLILFVKFVSCQRDRLLRQWWLRRSRMALARAASLLKVPGQSAGGSGRCKSCAEHAMSWQLADGHG